MAGRWRQQLENQRKSSSHSHAILGVGDRNIPHPGNDRGCELKIGRTRYVGVRALEPATQNHRRFEQKIIFHIEGEEISGLVE